MQVQIAIRLATAADHALIGRVFARASLSNEGDRENLLAHPELLEFDAAALDNGATRRRRRGRTRRRLRNTPARRRHGG